MAALLSILCEVITMRLRHLLILGLSIGLAGTLPVAAAPSNGQTSGQAGASANDTQQVRPEPRIYGSQLMTPAERSAYRARMRNLKTPQEREALRTQHHREMQKRAAERGMTLPDMPMGPGGMGAGHMGSGHMGTGSMGPGKMGPGRMGGAGPGQGAGMAPTQPQPENRQQTPPAPAPQGKDGG
jgi:hypothetical protein